MVVCCCVLLFGYSLLVLGLFSVVIACYVLVVCGCLLRFVVAVRWRCLLFVVGVRVVVCWLLWFVGVACCLLMLLWVVVVRYCCCWAMVFVVCWFCWSVC